MLASTRIIALVAVLCVPMSAFGGEALYRLTTKAPDSFSMVTPSEQLPAPAVAKRVDDMFFSGDPVTLSPKEQYAVQSVADWQYQSRHNVNPIAGVGGAVQFVYGLERPSVVCAVLQITDIELQAGEIILSVNIGDSARWIIEPAMSGVNIPHLLIKPMDVGLETSLTVATDRRMYHLRLRSHRHEYMARVAFTYPTDASLQFETMRSEALAKRERETIPETKEYLGDLDFNYVVTGKARWKPTRVYNDGVKTVIEFPDTLHQDDSPTLLVLRKRSGLFAKDEEVLVNYRVAQKNRYIVDAVFDKAVLIVGVGKGQVRVTIEREAKGGHE